MSAHVVSQIERLERTTRSIINKYRETFSDVQLADPDPRLVPRCRRRRVGRSRRCRSRWRPPLPNRAKRRRRRGTVIGRAVPLPRFLLPRVRLPLPSGTESASPTRGSQGYGVRTTERSFPDPDAFGPAASARGRRSRDRRPHPGVRVVDCRPILETPGPGRRNREGDDLPSAVPPSWLALAPRHGARCTANVPRTRTLRLLRRRRRHRPSSLDRRRRGGDYLTYKGYNTMSNVRWMASK